MEKKFPRRTYHSVQEMIQDMGYMVKNRREIRTLMRGDLVDSQFRERLMMAVTAVNGCRYCSYFHAKQALLSGLSPEEITALTRNELEACPPSELSALLYAQHWAETNAQPQKDVRDTVLCVYGEERLAAIEMTLRMIRMGNLLGNSFDAFLFRVSGGHMGGVHP